jgi:hypothetical protein
MLPEVISLLPDIACAIHSIPIISSAIATTKFKNITPSNGDARTIHDIATANMPTPSDNDLEPFETFFDDAPSIILAIPANNRPMPSKIAKNPVAYSGKARTVAPNPITMAPRMIFPAREDFERFGENTVAILSIPTTINAAASTTDTVATPTLGFTITESANPMAITPSPTCKSLSHDGVCRCTFLTSIFIILLYTDIKSMTCSL